MELTLATTRRMCALSLDYSPLPTASFEWSLALNFNHPKETSDYFVHYMGSIEGWPMHDNFASVGTSGGVAYISSSATMVRANTTLVVVHQPAVTCRSTPEFPCWIVLKHQKDAHCSREMTCHRPAVLRVASFRAPSATRGRGRAPSS